MHSFYELSVLFLGDLPVGFTFLYSIFAFILGVITVSVVFMFFKMCFHILGVKQMLEIFKFIFNCIGQVFNTMNNFLVVNGVSLLVFYLGFLVLPIILLIIKLGVDVGVRPLSSSFSLSNTENSNEKKEQKIMVVNILR